jgi:hypothetical protein
VISFISVHFQPLHFLHSASIRPVGSATIAGSFSSGTETAEPEHWIADFF